LAEVDGLRSIVGGIILAALILAPLAGCRSTGPAPATAPVPAAKAPAPPPPPKPERVAEEGGDAVFGIEDPFTSLSASKLSTPTDAWIRALVFRGLARLNAAGAPEPELATRWEESGGGTEWVLHLRPETRMTNGRYLEARHVVASWEKLILDPGSRHAWLLEAVNGFEDARSGKAAHLPGLILEDGLTLRVQLGWPVRNFPTRLAHPALGITAFGEDEEGAGPFQITGMPKSQEVVLRSNPEYFRGLPHLDEIAFIRGQAAGEDRIATGSLDGTALPSPPAAGPGSKGRILTPSVPRVYLLGLNRSAAPFSREETALKFLGGLNREALGDLAADKNRRVPAAIVEDLAPGKSAPPARAAPGEKVAGLGKVDLVYPESDRTASALAQKLQASIASSGGHPVLHPVRAGDLDGVLARREYHLFIRPFLPPSTDPLLEYEEVIRWNRSIPGDLAVRFKGLEGEGDPARRRSGLGPIDTELQEQGYLVPVLAVPRRFRIGRELCGLHPDPLGIVDWTRVWKSRSPGEECD
jgi:MarR-like DNA-binding transcriptional regulator SgrR of sgrS sRNA